MKTFPYPTTMKNRFLFDSTNVIGKLFFSLMGMNNINYRLFKGNNFVLIDIKQSCLHNGDGFFYLSIM